MDDLQPISILLLGDDEVGKSTFLSRLALLRSKDRLRGNPAEPPPLLRDSDQPFVVELRTRIAAFRLEFSDTASPENWRCLPPPDLVVLCYDISRRSTLTSLQTRWLGEVRTVFQHCDRLPILVLGLKRDLRREDDPEGTLYPHEAYNLAQQLRADMYLECSAVTGELMAQVVDDICRRAIQTATPEGGQSQGACSIM
ncbi:hypothetical protein SEUCBS139899_001560 [Sporothrix eucalyptigena]|uniref:Uncharacterized protein n=1 Tax=Sporothrix eucalyptigena TaxID=1812306 RepID=A0ABP0BN75_9PEZI